MEKKAASGGTLDVPCAPLGKGAPLEKSTEYLCGEVTAPKLESKSTVGSENTPRLKLTS